MTQYFGSSSKWGKSTVSFGPDTRIVARGSGQIGEAVDLVSTNAVRYCSHCGAKLEVT